MTPNEVFRAQLSEAERDALVAKLDAAGARLGVGKPPKVVVSNGDGTWDVGCTLEGEPDLLRDVLACFYLGISLP